MNRFNNAHPYIKLAIVTIVVCLIAFFFWQRLSRSATDMHTHASTPARDHALHDLEAESLRQVAAEYVATQTAITQLQETYDQQQKALNQRLSTLETTLTTVETRLENFASLPNPSLSSPITAPPNTIEPMPSIALGVVENMVPGIPLNVTDDPQTTVKDTSVPYYTIPANATSLNATLMTALIGRIPSQGQVHDPYPFKLIISQQTLAANGFTLPHVAGMVASGVAVGDLNLRSVRGHITSVTFVFDDGVIRTIGEPPTAAHHKDTPLGWLTDAYGNPAISGQLMTNAPAHLSTLLLLGGAKGAAGALTQEQLTYGWDAHTQTQTRTGDAAKWLLGQAGQQAAEEAMRWYTDRIQSSFDAIYVPAGHNVAVHFTQPIPIDYDPNDRRLQHDVPHLFAHHTDLD